MIFCINFKIFFISTGFIRNIALGFVCALHFCELNIPSRLILQPYTRYGNNKKNVLKSQINFGMRDGTRQTDRYDQTVRLLRDHINCKKKKNRTWNCLLLAGYSLQTKLKKNSIWLQENQLVTWDFCQDTFEKNIPYVNSCRQ